MVLLQQNQLNLLVLVLWQLKLAFWKDYRFGLS